MPNTDNCYILQENGAIVRDELKKIPYLSFNFDDLAGCLYHWSCSFCAKFGFLGLDLFFLH